jgi:hypothetical protein
MTTDPVWTKVEVAGLSIVTVHAVVAYFFIHASVILYRVTNVLLAATVLFVLRRAAFETVQNRALFGSLFFTCIAFAYTFPPAFE